MYVGTVKPHSFSSRMLPHVVPNPIFYCFENTKVDTVYVLLWRER